MSGIFGLYRLDGSPVDGQIGARMAARLRHRGPDGSSIWQQESVLLGHCLLRNTPESLHERQPLVCPMGEDGKVVITADARIDNRADLIAALGLETPPAWCISDSRLILAAYLRWGRNCLDHLLGDFAFAIWDGRERTLFCARDHFGVKPLYYHLSPTHFAFGSEIKAILCVPGIAPRLNEVRVGDYLARNFEDKQITFYEGIMRLPPAHHLAVRGDRQAPTCYWQPDLAHELRLRSNEEYVENFGELFAEAVRCRVRSAYPVASTLSGGLDSSSVAWVAGEALGGENRALHTFSAIFPTLVKVDARIDERRYIQSVLAHAAAGRFCPQAIRADECSPLVPRFWQADEVIMGINLYLDHAFCAAAQERGIRVLLTGHDGDSVVSHGWERLAVLACGLRWVALWRECSALAQTHCMRRRRLLWRQVVRPVWQQASGWRRGSVLTAPDWAAEMAIDPLFAREIGLAERMAAAGTTPLLPTAQAARYRHWEALGSGLFAYVMELVDQVATPFGVEMRHPFFDKRVVEFCLALPLAQKLQGGWTRAILRSAMAGKLPPNVCRRVSKADLSANFKLGLAKEAARVQEVIANYPAALQRYVSLPDLQRIYQRFLAQPLHAEQEALVVNSAVSLALWLQACDLAA